MEKTKVKSVIETVTRKYGIFLVFVALIIIGSFISPYFIKVKNVTNVLRQISVTGVLALAEMVLIISGQIDLSLGSVVALSGMFSVSAYLSTGSLAVGIIVAILVSVVCLTISGVLVAHVHLPAFIATMAMDYIARGICYIYTGGQATYEIGNYSVISTAYIGPIPLPVYIFFFMAIIIAVVMNKTTVGRDIFAVGGNQDAANASGINVRATIIRTFVIAGLLTGVAAVLQIARVNSAIPDTAMNYHGDAIASAIIGGTSFTGGVGTVFGCLVGSAIMGFLTNLLNLVGLDSYIQMVTKGVIIIGALAIDLTSKNKRIKKK
ncbi:ABC transporter permease [Parablautia sp. Marseille-Q6255]|uniref:ABC transporter permease n=1 Tax=Parablautia sp. Marseille-Q6255 TaxID=3039593 RepID=UPI0024BD5AE1|nr:ABC transporter permease [Parablautia sp. Marseille-Q6255]